MPIAPASRLFLRPIMALVLILAVWVDESSAQSRVIVFDSSSAALVGAPVRRQSRLVGLLGDYLRVPNGLNEFTLDLGEGRSLSVTLDVTDRGVVVRLFGQGPSGCGRRAVWKLVSWQGARVYQDRQRAEATRIILEPPDFQQTAGTSPRCPVPMALTCETYAAVPVESSPAGAEIWIDGTSTGMRTDTTLSVPYCPGSQRTYRILLRVPGQVNCERELLIPTGPLAVRCDLAAPVP